MRGREAVCAGAAARGPRFAVELRVDIELFSRGGLAVLDRIESMGYNTLQHRPAISRATQIGLLGRALLDRCFTWILPSAPPDNPGGGPGRNSGDAASAAAPDAAENSGQNHSAPAGRHA